MNPRAAAIAEFIKNHSSNETAALIMSMLATDKEWNAAKHKRGKNGRFVSTGGSGKHTEPRTRENRTKPIGKEAKKAASVHPPKDVTHEYFENARPGFGSVVVQRGVNGKKSAAEIAMAQRIRDEIGGDVIVLSEPHKNKEANPDLFWRGGLWELKTPEKTNWNSMDKKIRHGLEQIERNSCGIIIDLSQCGAKIEDVEKMIERSMHQRAKRDTDIVLFDGSGNHKVIRYKLKNASQEAKRERGPESSVASSTIQDSIVARSLSHAIWPGACNDLRE